MSASIPVGTAAGEGGARHATWLELFFDLVFVVAIAELTHGFADHPDTAHAVPFVLLFVATYLVWLNVSYYADLFDVDDFRSRSVLFATMLGGVALATGIHPALGGDVTRFVTVYVVLRLFLLGLYLRVALGTPGLRGFSGRFVAGYTVGALLWSASLFVPPPVQYGLWAAGLTVEAATPAVAYLTAGAFPTQESHMPERFGLFTIVALGETIVAVVGGLTGASWTTRSVAAAVLAFGLAVAMWWLYFDRLDESLTSRSVRGGRRSLLGGLGYSYGHYVVTFGITTTGVGAILALDAAVAGELLVGPGRTLLLGGVVAYLLGTVVAFGTGSLLGPRSALVRAGLALSLVVFWSLPPGLPVALTLGLVLAGLVVVVLVEESRIVSASTAGSLGGE